MGIDTREYMHQPRDRRQQPRLLKVDNFETADAVFSRIKWRGRVKVFLFVLIVLSSYLYVRHVDPQLPARAKQYITPRMEQAWNWAKEKYNVIHAKLDSREKEQALASAQIDDGVLLRLRGSDRALVVTASQRLRVLAMFMRIPLDSAGIPVPPTGGYGMVEFNADALMERVVPQADAPPFEMQLNPRAVSEIMSAFRPMVETFAIGMSGQDSVDRALFAQDVFDLPNQFESVHVRVDGHFFGHVTGVAQLRLKPGCALHHVLSRIASTEERVVDLPDATGFAYLPQGRQFTQELSTLQQDHPGIAQMMRGLCRDYPAAQSTPDSLLFRPETNRASTKPVRLSAGTIAVLGTKTSAGRPGQAIVRLDGSYVVIDFDNVEWNR